MKKQFLIIERGVYGIEGVIECLSGNDQADVPMRAIFEVHDSNLCVERANRLLAAGSA
jgi:hypothetical protein